MAILHIPIFHGIAPRLAARKLDHAQSQIARSCELFSEELRPLNDGLQVATPSKTGTKKSIYKLGNIWLHWTTDVDVARNHLFEENDSLIHYSGDYNPKSTDATLAEGVGTDYPTDFYRLGLPRPDTAPTVSHTGGTQATIERSYVYTFVTAWGEEGPPSAVGTYEAPSDATQWDISTIDLAPPNQWTQASGAIASIAVSGSTVVVTLNATYNHFLETKEYVTFSGTLAGTGDLPDDLPGTHQITRVSALVFTIPTTSNGTVTSGAVIDREAPIQTTGMIRRLYRTLGGNYRLVDDITSAVQTTYTDAVADTALAELLPGGVSETDWWKAPDGDLQGIHAFPGGILVGHFGSTVAFSEPYVPSAWPDKYQYNFNHSVVGIGVVGNMVVVTTDGHPSLLLGDDPGSMDPSDLEKFQSCVSKRGIAKLSQGVLYPSPDGMVYVPTSGMPEIITKAFFKKKEWNNLVNPSSLIGVAFDDRYYGFYSGAGDDNNESGVIVFDPQEPGATFTTLAFIGTAAFSDLETDNMYYVEDGSIIQYEGGSGYLVYTWLSKLFTTATPLCFKAGKIKMSLGEDATTVDVATSIEAAITALEAILANTALASGFGGANNYVSGALGGFSVGKYTVGGGPYMAATQGIQQPVTAILNIYAHFSLAEGEPITRNLVHTQALTNSKPFRVGNVLKGYLADQWEVEFNCNNATIHEALLGTSMRELTLR